MKILVKGNIVALGHITDMVRLVEDDMRAGCKNCDEKIKAKRAKKGE